MAAAQLVLDRATAKVKYAGLGKVALDKKIGERQEKLLLAWNDTMQLEMEISDARVHQSLDAKRLATELAQAKAEQARLQALFDAAGPEQAALKVPGKGALPADAKESQVVDAGSKASVLKLQMDFWKDHITFIEAQQQHQAKRDANRNVPGAGPTEQMDPKYAALLREAARTQDGVVKKIKKQHGDVIEKRRKAIESSLKELSAAHTELLKLKAKLEAKQKAPAVTPAPPPAEDPMAAREKELQDKLDAKKQQLWEYITRYQSMTASLEGAEVEDGS